MSSGNQSLTVEVTSIQQLLPHRAAISPSVNQNGLNVTSTVAITSLPTAARTQTATCNHSPELTFIKHTH